MLSGIMTAAQYNKLRKRIGSQQKVASLVGVDIRTVQRREAGSIPITAEASRAITSLAAREAAQRLLASGQVFKPEIEELLGLLR